jgi:prolipoprotein diacylglyceryltransferase
MDAVAPALLVAQAIGRIGNYFNQELFGGPTSLPWGLQNRAAVPARGLPGVRNVPAHLLV